MIIFGRNSVREALNSSAKLEKIYIQDDVRGSENQALVDSIKQSGVPYNFLNKKAMDKKANNERHQGFIAEMSSFEYSELDEIVESARQNNEQIFLVLLDGIEDPHNLGSIIRSCECAGVQGVVIEKRNSCEINSTVMKVSAGAINHIKVAKVGNLVQAIEYLKKQNVWVYAVELGGQNIYDANLKGDIAVVIGSEGFGTRRIVKEKSDVVVSIPMKGKVNSLNASNACAIALFEALRQRL